MDKKFEGKKLLIIGGINTECDIVNAAKAMGVYTVVADYDLNAPAKSVADKFVPISATDVDKLVDFCKREKIDGVITGFVDILLKPYHDVCERLGLPCYITPKMLSMSTNKVDFKNTCQEYDVPVPRTYYVGNVLTTDVLDIVNYPVFVKPLDGSGSRGAGVCNNQNDLIERFKEAASYSSSGNAIIEDYITGREFLLDYIAVNGEFRLFSIFDRYISSDRGSAINYSNLAVAPSRCVDYYLENINEKVISMFRGLGFTDGLLFMQGYYNGGKVTFYEMGCRLGGSYYNHEQFCFGDNAASMVVRYALSGKMVDDISKISKHAAKYEKYAADCNYLLKGDNETVRSFVGVEEAKKLTDCISIKKYHDIGYHYVKDRSVDRPILTIGLVSNSKKELIESIAYLNQIIDVRNDKGESLLTEKLDPNQALL